MKQVTLAKAVAAALCSCPLFVWSAPVLSILPGTQTAGFNQTVTVSVVLSGLTSVAPRQIVSAFDLDVLFSAALLTQLGTANFLAQAVMGGAGLVVFDTLGTGPGVATGNAFSLVSDAALLALQGDSVTLMSFSFVTRSTDGAAQLNFGPSLDFERLVVGRGGLAMPLTYTGACIAIGNGSCGQVVPEPASFGLAAIALLGAGLAGRSTRRRLAAVVQAG